MRGWWRWCPATVRFVLVTVWPSGLPRRTSTCSTIVETGSPWCRYQQRRVRATPYRHSWWRLRRASIFLRTSSCRAARRSGEQISPSIHSQWRPRDGQPLRPLVTQFFVQDHLDGLANLVAQLMLDRPPAETEESSQPSCYSPAWRASFAVNGDVLWSAGGCAISLFPQESGQIPAMSAEQYEEATKHLEAADA